MTRRGVLCVQSKRILQILHFTLADYSISFIIILNKWKANIIAQAVRLICFSFIFPLQLTCSSLTGGHFYCRFLFEKQAGDSMQLLHLSIIIRYSGILPDMAGSFFAAKEIQLWVY